MFEITITEQDYLFCITVAAMRNMVARGNNVEDRQVGDQSAIKTDLIGVIGEYAFCKRNNIFPDLVASPRSGSYDCIFKGYRIDVKATHYKEGKLLATTKKNNLINVDHILEQCKICSIKKHTSRKTISRYI